MSAYGLSICASSGAAQVLVSLCASYCHYRISITHIRSYRCYNVLISTNILPAGQLPECLVNKKDRTCNALEQEQAYRYSTVYSRAYRPNANNPLHPVLDRLSDQLLSAVDTVIFIVLVEANSIPRSRSKGALLSWRLAPHSQGILRWISSERPDWFCSWRSSSISAVGGVLSLAIPRAERPLEGRFSLDDGSRTKGALRVCVTQRAVWPRVSRRLHCLRWART